MYCGSMTVRNCDALLWDKPIMHNNGFHKARPNDRHLSRVSTLSTAQRLLANQANDAEDADSCLQPEESCAIHFGKGLLCGKPARFADRGKTAAQRAIPSRGSLPGPQ